jgi:membrane-associated phospholipid phosphatase
VRYTAKLTIHRKLRVSEWILLAYYIYVSIAAMTAGLPVDVVVRAWLMPPVVAAIFVILSRPAFHYARDWAPLILLLTAYHEMDWFTIGYKSRYFEQLWLRWDQQYLFDHGFQHWIEALGPVLPWLLEFAYFLVYGIGAFSVAAFYFGHRRFRIDQFMVVYLVGTLGAYVLFPLFPSDPPRVLFPGANSPHYLNAFRRLNLWLVGGYGIHSSVFPSAHVSSAFSAAWGLLRFLPEYRWAGWTMLGYAIAVWIATVYGRYHFAVDGLGGLAISLIALAVAALLRPVPASTPRS